MMGSSRLARQICSQELVLREYVGREDELERGNEGSWGPAESQQSRELLHGTVSLKSHSMAEGNLGLREVKGLTPQLSPWLGRPDPRHRVSLV